MSHYELKFGSYYLIQNGSPTFMMDQIAIAYTGEVLIKHGPPEFIKSYAKQHNLECVIFPMKFPVDEINRCISTSGYIAKLVKDIQQGVYDNWVYDSWDGPSEVSREEIEKESANPQGEHLGERRKLSLNTSVPKPKRVK